MGRAARGPCGGAGEAHGDDRGDRGGWRRAGERRRRGRARDPGRRGIRDRARGPRPGPARARCRGPQLPGPSPAHRRRGREARGGERGRARGAAARARSERDAGRIALRGAEGPGGDRALQRARADRDAPPRRPLGTLQRRSLPGLPRERRPCFGHRRRRPRHRGRGPLRGRGPPTGGRRVLGHVRWPRRGQRRGVGKCAGPEPARQARPAAGRGGCLVGWARLRRAAPLVPVRGSPRLVRPRAGSASRPLPMGAAPRRG